MTPNEVPQIMSLQLFPSNTNKPAKATVLRYNWRCVDVESSTRISLARINRFLEHDTWHNIFVLCIFFLYNLLDYSGINATLPSAIFERFSVSHMLDFYWSILLGGNILDGQAPLIADPPLTSCDIWHVTHDMWHVTHDMWHMTCDMWHMTCDTWHVTHDMWHMTCDTWHVTHVMWHLTCDKWGEVNLFSKCPLPTSYDWGMKVVENIFTKDDWLK